MPARVILALALLAVSATAVRADVAPPFAPHLRTAAGHGLSGTFESVNLATLTGQSPWLVMGFAGAYTHFTTTPDDPAHNHLLASPWVFGPMLLLVALVALKDSVLSPMVYLKVWLDALGQVMHAVGGVAGLAYLGVVAFGGGPSADALLAPDAPPPAPPDPFSATALWVLLAAVHTATFIVFNTVEVAVVLSPFPFVDTTLKAGRTAFVGVLALAARIHPLLGFAAALPVIVACFLLVRVAWRFSVAGWTFTADTLKRMVGVRTPPPDGPLRAFSTWHTKGVKAYTLGTVERTADGSDLQFVFPRFFGLLKDRVPISKIDVAVSTGVAAPALVTADGGKPLLRFPPRYSGHEAELALRLGLGEVVQRTTFRGGVRAAWQAIRARLFKPTPKPDAGER